MATRLLLADDSITIQKVVKLTFAAEDVAIDAVGDGTLAIEKTRSSKPDIVLADVFMPGRNGYEVCAAIKGDPELSATPVVLLVGTFEPFDEAEASRAKCDAYLTKPFDTSELIQIVNKLVAQRRSAEASVKTSKSSQMQVDLVAAAGGAGHAAEHVTGLVSERTRESFLGAASILDLFETPVQSTSPSPQTQTEAAQAAASATSVAEGAADRASTAASHVIPFPGTRANGAESQPVALTEEMLDVIAEKVVKRMSQDVVREIAWEVVPQLSEAIIRQYLDKSDHFRKS